jgi:hypothetical protein
MDTYPGGAAREAGGGAVAVLWAALAVLWAAVLVFAIGRNGEPWAWPLFAELRFSGLDWALVRAVAAAAALRILLFVPLGVLCALAVSGRERPGLHRGVPALAAAAALSLGLAFVVAGFTAGSGWRAPGLLEMTLPAAGCAVGVVLAGAFRRPPPAWLPSLALRSVAMLAVGALAGLLAAWAALSEGPASAPRAEVTSGQKRELVEALRRHNPLKIADEESTTLSLSPEQLQASLAWGALLLDPEARALVRGDAEGLSVLASVRLPAGLGGRRHLAVAGTLDLETDGERLRLRRCTLSLGALPSGSGGCRALLQGIHRLVFAAPENHALVAGVEHVRLDGRGAVARYGRVELDDEFRGRLQDALGPGDEIRAAAQAQFDMLRTDAARIIAASPDRFGAVLQASFGLAAERAVHGSSAAENQGAILALATLLGHPDVATMAGIERPEDWREIREALWPVRLRGRTDWTQHFLISAAITQAATAVVSDAAGLLKEELDAAGSSGFSFADLLADRAGTVFGEAAARDEETARAVQRLVGGYRVEHVMPEAADLPERISDGELTSRYGGVGGARYQEVVADIEARVAALPWPLGEG